MGDIAGSLNPTCDTTAAEGKVTLASSTILIAPTVASLLGGWRTIRFLGIRDKTRSKKQSVNLRPTSSFGVHTRTEEWRKWVHSSQIQEMLLEGVKGARGCQATGLVLHNMYGEAAWAGSDGTDCTESLRKHPVCRSYRMDKRFWSVSPTGDFNAQRINSFSPHVSGWVEPIAVRQPDLSALQAVRLREQGDVSREQMAQALRGD